MVWFELGGTSAMVIEWMDSIKCVSKEKTLISLHLGCFFFVNSISVRGQSNWVRAHLSFFSIFVSTCHSPYSTKNEIASCLSQGWISFSLSHAKNWVRFYFSVFPKFYLPAFGLRLPNKRRRLPGAEPQEGLLRSQELVMRTTAAESCQSFIICICWETLIGDCLMDFVAKLIARHDSEGLCKVGDLSFKFLFACFWSQILLSFYFQAKNK